MMKKQILCVIILIFGACGLVSALDQKPDFLVRDILAGKDQFIYLKLENSSPWGCTLDPTIQEKVFLTIFINNIKRAEYKTKYIDRKLFSSKGQVFFRTNFRLQDRLKIKAEINNLRIIPETNFLDNVLEKELIAKK